MHAVPVDGHNLVPSQTSLIGHEAVIADVKECFDSNRIVTLTGPGGVGKTHITIAVGLTMAPGWEDGVWLVDLSPLGERSLIGVSVASAVGVVQSRSAGDWGPRSIICASVARFLILDNCEQLISDVAAMVSDVLVACPDVSVLATSREPLGVAGEVVMRVDTLHVPEAHDVDATSALKVPSVRLFVERAPRGTA